MNAAGRLECSLHGGTADVSGWIDCSVTRCGHAPDEQTPIVVTAVEIVNGVEVPIGEPRERTISRGALDLLHGPNWDAEPGPGLPAALLDRRQRAIEAGCDDPHSFNGRANVAAAIETATRVRIDADVTQAAHDAQPRVMVTTSELRDMITAAFRAAGFEVEQ